MHRRDTLRKCAVLGATGGLSLLAGCSGGEDGSETEQSSLSIETFDYREGDSGNFVATVTVKNSGEAEASGKLYLDVTAAEPTSETETEEDGDDTTATRESLDVTVPAGETKTVSVPFDLTIEQFERNGSLEVDIRS